MAAMLLVCLPVALTPMHVAAIGNGSSSETDRDAVFTSIIALSEESRTEIDATIRGHLSGYDYLDVALVSNGEIVYVASYGRDRRGHEETYASVSKPVTATIALMLVQTGLIGSLDDSITTYTDRFDTILPRQYANRRITIRQLLTHQSGLPEETPLVRIRPWPFLFAPGTNASYSTWGYGLLGAILEEATGTTYDELVEELIGGPVGAASLRADDLRFDTPGERVRSTIEDMARFAIGIINGVYYDEQTLRNVVLHPYGYDGSEYIGLGWYIANPDECDAALYHPGSDGRQRSFLVVKPFQGDAVCIAGLRHDEQSEGDLQGLAVELMTVVTTAP
jgi:CubicO group peptidase (beta-lactamase class C family)